MTAYNYRGRLGAAITSSMIKISRKRKSLTLGDTGPPLSIEYALSTIEAPTVNITTKYHYRFHRRYSMPKSISLATMNTVPNDGLKENSLTQAIKGEMGRETTTEDNMVV